METVRLQYILDIKKIIATISIIELFYLLLLIKSSILGALFMVMILGSFLLYLMPEFGFAIPFTINILLYYLFDFVNSPISMPAFRSYLLIFFFSIIIYHIKSEKKKIFEMNHFFWVAILIGLILLAGIPYSANKFYGAKKFIFYFLVNIPLLYAAYLLKDNDKGMEKLFASIFAIGLVMAIISFFTAQSNIFFKFVRFRLSESIGPLYIGRAFGISIVAGLYFFSKFKRIAPKILFGIAVVIIILPIIWSGSRGPTLGVLLSILLYYYLQPSQSIPRKLIFTAFFVIAALYYLLSSSTQVSARIATPIGNEASAAFRVLAWIQAIQQFIGSPLLGIGTGSFYLDTKFIPLVYPHNIILELACENGILGLIIIVYFLYLATRQGLKNISYYNQQANTSRVQLSIAAFTFFFFSAWNAMFSGDIYANAIVWWPAGLIWALSQESPKSSSKQRKK